MVTTSYKEVTNMSWFKKKPAPPKQRVIDWDKVNDFESLKIILRHTTIQAYFTEEGLKAVMPFTKEIDNEVM